MSKITIFTLDGEASSRAYANTSDNKRNGANPR